MLSILFSLHLETVRLSLRPLINHHAPVSTVESVGLTFVSHSLVYTGVTAKVTAAGTVEVITAGMALL